LRKSGRKSVKNNRIMVPSIAKRSQSHEHVKCEYIDDDVKL